jgi:alkylation response protein AidB-like acyl-CoA dehydrogenase
MPVAREVSYMGSNQDSRAGDEEAVVLGRVAEFLAAYPPARLAPEQLWGAQYDAGLAWVPFPEGRGGLGISPRWQNVVDSAIVTAGGSVANRAFNVVGVGLVAATLVTHGSAQQQQRWLRPIFTTEEIWCQLFSEPGSGSDLAGLATSAVPHGDGWRVNGQKVWTTLAHRAKWGLLIARSDPDVPKHRGITCFAVDMHQPGVEVRPLYELTGEAEFNEVYLDDVRVPDSFRIGEADAGWTVATTTLMNERVMAPGAVGARGSGLIEQAVTAWRAASRPVLRQDELARHWVSAEVLRLTQLRASESARQGTPGPEGSVAKLRWAEVNQAITTFTMDLLGPDAMAYPGGYDFSRPDSSQAHTQLPHKAFLRARANSIEGGTSEIMRNILAQRVLAMPADKPDRDIPWRRIRRA